MAALPVLYDVTSTKAYKWRHCRFSMMFMKWWGCFFTSYSCFAADTCPTGRLIEFGSGPCVYQFISASKRFNYIVCGDFYEANNKEIRMWLEQDKNAYDFTAMFRLIGQLEKG